MTGAIESEVDLAVGSEGADEALELLADDQRACQFSAIEQAAVLVVDDRAPAKRRLAFDNELHGLAFHIVGWREVEPAVESRARDDAIRAFIQCDANEHPVARPQ